MIRDTLSITLATFLAVAPALAAETKLGQPGPTATVQQGQGDILSTATRPKVRTRSPSFARGRDLVAASGSGGPSVAPTSK